MLIDLCHVDRMVGPGRPWVARVSGYDAEFGLARQFLEPVQIDDKYTFDLVEPGLYELRYSTSDGILTCYCADYSLPDQLRAVGYSELERRFGAQSLRERLAKSLTITVPVRAGIGEAMWDAQGNLYEVVGLHRRMRSGSTGEIMTVCEAVQVRPAYYDVRVLPMVLSVSPSAS